MNILLLINVPNFTTVAQLIAEICENLSKYANIIITKHVFEK